MKKRNTASASFKSLKKAKPIGGKKKIERGSFHEFNELKSIRGALLKAIGKLDTKMNNL